MALTTLPYPSLDFVPLDILTAEEMNQIVANYTAINNSTIGTSQLADSSITTPKLANKAVTSAKVDWTTLPYKYVYYHGTQNIGTTALTQLTNMSFTIETAGAYFIALVGNYQVNGTAGSYPRFGIYIGDDRKFYSAVSTMAGLQNNFVTFGIINVTAGAVVSGKVTGGSCTVFEGCRMVAIRVG